MKMRHIVDPATEEWYHLDERFRVWSCACKEERGVGLCLTSDDILDAEGELRRLNREISLRRKQLGLKVSDPWPDEKDKTPTT